ncbi:aspartate/glutamate racemase family protein [Streptomyces sp. NPDC048291]|uniref:aspartate/glutamate racemase family protein n=1 Tax=Streptomyces sp. NPDC048291 TaxID=3365530 RepID=UPI0037227691
MRICFLKPFGTPAYNQLIHDVLTPSLQSGTEVEVRNLDIVPENMDYFAAKHLVEVGIMKAAIRAERDGFDAFVIGCCYDPGLTQCRELVDIPVVGPLEASIMNARPFGHRYAVVTGHHKAATEIADRVRIYGQEQNCLAVSHVGWFIDDMIKSPAAVAQDAYGTSLRIMREAGAETIVIACTIVSACYEITAAKDESLRGISVIDPNIMAVKQAEMLASLNAVGQYRIARTGYYQQVAQHSTEQAAEIHALLTDE